MKVGVVGASGYAGGELLRILAGHPEFEIAFVSAGQNVGELITAIHPHLQQFRQARFEELNIPKLNECDLIFLALPHGESAKIVNRISQEVKIVDLGADFRLADSSDWKKYYGGEHAGSWSYGLPELVDPSIYRTGRISNPGCYATAISLAVAPMFNVSEIDTSDVVVVAASGTTGAGRSNKVNLSASEVMNNMTSYKFAGVHQHTPEIEQLLSKIAGDKIKVSFTPILAPMPRGILATVTCKYLGDLMSDRVRSIFADFYLDKGFVKVLPEGILPNTAAVFGSNYAHLQIGLDTHTNRIVVSIAIDNLGKGAAGQAVQNANILFGFSEELGLTSMGIK